MPPETRGGMALRPEGVARQTVTVTPAHHHPSPAPPLPVPHPSPAPLLLKCTCGTVAPPFETLSSSLCLTKCRLWFTGAHVTCSPLLPAPCSCAWPFSGSTGELCSPHRGVLPCPHREEALPRSHWLLLGPWPPPLGRLCRRPRPSGWPPFRRPSSLLFCPSGGCSRLPPVSPPESQFCEVRDHTCLVCCPVLSTARANTTRQKWYIVLASASRYLAEWAEG